MPACVAYGCKNHSNKRTAENLNLSFHKFPKDTKLKKMWIKAVRRAHWKPSAYSLLCSEHFKEEDFDKTSPFRVYLKKHSVPTIFKGIPGEFSPSEQKRNSVSKEEQTTVWSHAENTTVTCIERTDSVRVKNFSLCATQTESLSSGILGLKEKQTSMSYATTQTEGLSLGFGAFELYPEKKIIALEETVLKLKKLHTKCRCKPRNIPMMNNRLTKKIVTLSRLLKELKLKRLLPMEYIDLLKNICPTSSCLMKRNSDMEISPKLRKKYDNRVKNFAVTLGYLSPKAYAYVRNTFHTYLPHPIALSKWYETAHGQPGFSTEVLSGLKNMTRHELVCALLFDTMDIRKHVHWDGNKLVGLVDLGGGNANDSSPLASEVLVFHLVFFNSVLKIPFGYFFVDSFTGEQIHFLILRALTLLNEAGVFVATITFDGYSSSIAAAKHMKYCTEDLSAINTTFKFEGQDVELILDACHMLKLIRNTLHDFQQLIDNRGQTIEWLHLQLLLHLKDNKLSHLKNKISKCHIYFSCNQMKVKYASELFSKITSDALEHCLVNQIQGFENCKGTINFVRIISDLFEIFTSRSLREKFLKQAMFSGNHNIIFDKLNEGESYIKGLKDKNGSLVCNGKRKTGFVGFLSLINSTRNLYRRLVGNGRLEYLSMYTANQENLKRLFDFIRNISNNKNPSAFEFYYTWIKILMHESCTSQISAIPLDVINLIGIDLNLNNGEDDKVKTIDETSAVAKVMVETNTEGEIQFYEVSGHDYL